MPTRPSLSLILTATILAGCGTSTPPQEPSTETTKASAPASEDRSAPAVSASPAVEPITTRTPEEVSRLAVQSLIDAQPEKFWGLLPPSYQGLINKVVQKGAHRFADQELLNAYQGVLREVVELMKEKQEFFIATPVLPFHADPEKAKAKWGDLVARMNRVADSELFDALPLKKFDGQRFAAGPAADLMAIYNEIMSLSPENPVAALQEKLNHAKFEVVTASETETTLSMSTGEAEPQKYQFQKVEGYWLPEPFITSFAGMIGSAESTIENYSIEDFEKQKAVLIGQAAGVQEYLKGLRAIESQEAFNGELNGLVMKLLPMMFGGDTDESGIPERK
ncbi:hypothetical protein [Lacunimicrobium album]